MFVFYYLETKVSKINEICNSLSESFDYFYECFSARTTADAFVYEFYLTQIKFFSAICPINRPDIRFIKQKGTPPNKWAGCLSYTLRLRKLIYRIAYSLNDPENDIPKEFSRLAPLAGALVENIKSDRHLYILTETAPPSSGIVP